MNTIEILVITIFVITFTTYVFLKEKQISKLESDESIDELVEEVEDLGKKLNAINENYVHKNLFEQLLDQLDKKEAQKPAFFFGTTNEIADKTENEKKIDELKREIEILKILDKENDNE